MGYDLILFFSILYFDVSNRYLSMNLLNILFFNQWSNLDLNLNLNLNLNLGLNLNLNLDLNLDLIRFFSSLNKVHLILNHSNG